jgi:hypothetical protein
MKQIIASGVALITTLGCTPGKKGHDMAGQHHQEHSGHAHQHAGPTTAAQLIVTTDPSSPSAGQPVTLRLMIHAPDGTMVRNFDVLHEEKVHLVIVRDGLDHFAHIHPAVDSKGNLTVTHAFPAGGNYGLFADYKPAGGAQSIATGSVSIGGQSPPAPPLNPNAPGEVQADGLRAQVSAAPLRAGSPARVTFSLRDDRGKPAALEPYMGELGHLMFIGVRTRRYVHVHPAGGDATLGTVTFEAHFPEPGLYKGWGQFKHHGRVRVIPFVLNVE